MLSHIVSDLHEHYVKEILEPKIGKDISAAKSTSSSSEDKSEDDISKQARQLVYDVRYRARREGIPIEKAYTQHIGNSPAPSKVKEIAKEKLFGKPGSSVTSAPPSSVKENLVREESENKKFQIRVTDKSSGKTYVRMATREKMNQLRANPNISSVEMTKYGKPYEGEKLKGSQTASVTSGKGLTDYDGDGKKESGSKEHAGVVHNAIQRKTGGIPDGKDTRKKTKENKKSYGMSEKFVNWRSDLIEVTDSDTKERSIDRSIDKDKGKKVSNTIVINPDLKIEDVVKNLGGKLINIVEEELVEDINVSDIFEEITNAEFYFVSNDLIEEVVEEFFTECLDEGYDIDFIIESALESLDNSIDFLNEQVLMELNPYAPAGSKESKDYNKATTQSKKSAERAEKRAEKIKKVKDTVKRVGSSINSGLKRAGKAVAYGTGYVAGKAISTAKKVGSEIKKGYDDSKESEEPEKKSTTRRSTTRRSRSSSTISKIGSALKSGLKRAVEKAARSVSRGARNVARSMGEALDQKVVDQQSSSDDNLRSTQSDAVKKQQIQNLKMIQQKRQMLDRQKLMMQKSNKLPLEASYQPEGEVIDEKTLTSAETKKKEEIVKSMKKSAGDFEKRYPGRGKNVMYATATKKAKEVAEQIVNQPEGNVIDELTKYAEKTGKKFTTGRKSVKGGNPAVAARNKLPGYNYGGSRQEPKDRGKKPPSAGESGSGRQDPAHIVALRRAARKTASEFRMDTRGT